MNNASWWERATKVLPGGVNSPVRSFKSVPGEPLFFKKAAGCRFTDEDGRSYIDWCLSWGPLILGHADPRVIEAVSDRLHKGLSFDIKAGEIVGFAGLIGAGRSELFASRPVPSRRPDHPADRERRNAGRPSVC